MPFVKTFKQINKKSAEQVGNKAATLGELTRYKIPIPAGFVIITTAFEQYIKSNNLIVKINDVLFSTNYEDKDSIKKASAKLKRLISRGLISDKLENEVLKSFDKLETKHVAVRTTIAIANPKHNKWAKDLDLCNNIKRTDILNTIKKSWAALYSVNSLTYRYQNGLIKQNLSVAIIVQTTVKASISGRCYTINPKTFNKKEMLITASYGLKQGISNNLVKEDSYFVNKNKARFNILKKQIRKQAVMIITGTRSTKKSTVPVNKQSKQKLEDELILQLSQIAYNIERICESHQELEWAYVDNQFYITQAHKIEEERKK
jgi:pyruvate,water dikinase